MPPRRPRPLTWNELLDAADRAEARLWAVIGMARVPHRVRHELRLISDELLRPVLVRTGRRPENGQ